MIWVHASYARSGRGDPAYFKGIDVIACAQTGTGKTAAFVLPTLHRCSRSKEEKRVRALIVAPTRELALQSMEHLEKPFRATCRCAATRSTAACRCSRRPAR